MLSLHTTHCSQQHFSHKKLAYLFRITKLRIPIEELFQGDLLIGEHLTPIWKSFPHQIVADFVALFHFIDHRREGDVRQCCCRRIVWNEDILQENRLSTLSIYLSRGTDGQTDGRAGGRTQAEWRWKQWKTWRGQGGMSKFKNDL